MSEKQEILRHVLAVLAYRTRKALAGAPDDFGEFQPARGVRTPLELLHHMSELIACTLAALRAEPPERLATLPGLDRTAHRFYFLLHELSEVFAEGPVGGKGLPERLLQGPLADAMTHTGQLALLRRLAGTPVAAEDFFEADITVQDLEPVSPPDAAIPEKLP